MAEKIYDVVGIGNAIVDIIARCDDGFISKHDLVKGSMRLIDADEANRLYGAMGEAIQEAGRVKIAGPGQIYDVIHLLGRNLDRLALGHDHRAFLRAGEHGKLAVLQRGVGSLFEAVHLIKGGNLFLVGKYDVGAFANEFSEILAVPINAEGVGEAQRDLRPGFLGGACSFAKGGLGVVPIE